MGQACSGEQQQVDRNEVQPEAEAKDVVTQVAEALEDAKEKIEEVAEQAKEAVQDAAEAVVEAAAELKDTAEEKTAEVQEKAADAVAEAKEAAADTMTAAVAAVTGNLIVEFADSKGNAKSVDFTVKALGFSSGLAGGGCCAKAPKSKVVVSKVDKKQQAEKLGVQRGWEIKAINGTRFAGLEEAQKLLEEARSQLPETAA